MTTKIKSGVISDNAITSAHISSGAISSSHLTGIDTDAVSEGSSNLYFTTARARTSLSVTDSGGDGSLTYDNSTGAITYTGPSASEVRAHISVTDSGGDGSLAYSNGVITYVGPSASEVRAHLSAGTGVTYSSGEFSIGQSVATTASPTFADINITGDLNITGDVNSLSVTDLDVTDQTITLGAGQNEASSGGSGIVVDGSGASILWDEANDEWDFNKAINVTGTVTADGLTVDGNATITTAGSTVLLVEATGDNDSRVRIRSGTSNISYVEFADPGDADTGEIRYDHNTNSMQFRVNGNQEAITIDSNKNVGIGTDSPNSPLEIVKNITFTNSDTFPQLLIKTTATTTGNQLGLGVDETDNVAFIEAIDRGTNVIPLVLQRNGGRVGIGIDNPGFALDISNTTSAKINLQGGTNQNGIRFASAGNDGVSSSLYYLGVGSDLMGGTDYGALLLDVTNNRSVLFDDQSTSRLGFYNNSMVINSSGNVGIGETSPLGKLHVKSADSSASADATADELVVEGSGNSGLSILSGASNYGTILFSDSGDSAAGRIRYEHDNNALNFGTNGSWDRFYINSSGNVGINWNGTTARLGIIQSGSSTPGMNITDGGTSDFIVYAGYSTGIARIGPSAGQLAIQTGGTERMRIGSSGNVGIGTTGPGHKLHIHGGSANTNLAVTTDDNYISEVRMMEDSAGTQHGGFIRYDGNGDYVRIGHYNTGTTDIGFTMRDNLYSSFGETLLNPAQNFVVGVPSGDNCDPPGLGNSTANFAILKRDDSAAGNYGIITGISSDGNVWSQVQRTDGTATAYNLYLQPDGGSVGIGVPQNHIYIPNLIYPLRVAKQRTGTGNVTDYLSKIAIDGMGYGGSNYQMAAIDFTGGDTAGKSGNVYGRIGCSSMNGANNQEEGSLEFFVRAPGYSMETSEAMKICGKAGTSIAGSGNSRNGVLFPFQGIAIDRTWANYPGIAVGNSSHYSSTASTQAEFRFHGANFSSDSYPGTSGSDFSVNVRTDGSFISTSDGRAKTNITTIDNALEKVNQLTGKRFQRINRENEPQEHLSKNGYKFGFIAQEIEDIIPEAVQYHADEDDGTENWNSAYAMDYGSVVALLVNAIKEQDEVIQDLKTRIETLEE